MKILKQLTVAAVAAAVLLTGCQNSFTGTSRDVGVLADISKSTASTNLTVTSVAGAAALVNAKNQQIVFTFSEPVDQDTILSAVTVRPVTNGTAATTTATAVANVQGTAITPVIQYVSGNAVYLGIDLSTVASNTLEVFIDSTKLTARKGVTKLDIDGDEVQGEGQDDDYYTQLSVGASGVTGAPTIVNVTTDIARNPRAYFTLTASGATWLTTGSTFDVTLGISAGDTTDYSSMLNSAIVIEKYVPATGSSGSWTAVTKNFSKGLLGVYSAAFAAATDGDVYRVRVASPSSIKTTPLVSGFQQKYNSDNRVTEVLLAGPTAASLAATTILSTTQQSNTLSSIASNFDGNGLNGKIIIGVTNTDIGNQGINSATVTNASIRILAYQKAATRSDVEYYTDSGYTLPYSTVVGSAGTYSSTGASTLMDYTTVAFTYVSGKSVVKDIILNLDPAYSSIPSISVKSVSTSGGGYWIDTNNDGSTNSSDAYLYKKTVTKTLTKNSSFALVVSSALKGLGDDATIPVATRIPVRSFGNPSNVDTIPALIGTYTIAGTGSL